MILTNSLCECGGRWWHPEGLSGARFGVAMALLLTCDPLVAQAVDDGVGQHIVELERALNGHVDQQDIQRGVWSVSQLQEAGRRLFLANFTVFDGAGRPASRGTELPRRRLPKKSVAFSRAAGPDANSCASCHHQPELGGAGDFVANAFLGLGDKPEQLTSTSSEYSNERGTPELHGSGVIELLAREITEDLHAIRYEVILQARQQSTPITETLASKGIEFGTISADPDGEVDTSGVLGIDEDLIIRPFGSKGTSVSLRQFTVFAANQHHGMQATERFGQEQTGYKDFDADGVTDELTAGDITALVVFQATLNMPGRILPDDETVHREIRQGESLFGDSKCANCHRPSLPLRGSIFREPGPYNHRGTLLAEEVANAFTIDLSKDAAAPRLARSRSNPDGEERYLVQVYTDFKRHVLSDDDRPHFGNESVEERRLDTRAFLTRRLWAVGNTAPYGHRGDLTTLWEAIDAHGGDAADARLEFVNRPNEEQRAIILFLKSMCVVPAGSVVPIIRPRPETLPYRLN